MGGECILGKKLGFLVVGIGRIGRQYAEALKQGIEGAVLEGVYLPEATEREMVSQRYRCRSLPNFEAYLEDSRINVVIVASPSYTHEEIAVKALQAGKHVILEKPMALSLPGAKRIIKAANTSKAKLMVSFPERFNPVFQKAKQLLEAGIIGDVISVKCKRRTKSTFRPEWYWQEKLSKGVIWDLACHDIDLCRWLLGREVVSVFAMGLSVMKNKEVIDNAFLDLTFSGNTMGHLEASWTLPDKYPAWGDIQLEMLGTEGVLVTDTGLNQPVNICGRGESISFIHPANYSNWTAVDISRENLIKDMLTSFVRAVSVDGDLPITGEDGLRAIEVAVAATTSMIEKRTIQLDQVKIHNT